MTADEEQVALDEFSEYAKRILIVFGVDGYGDQGAFVNARVGLISAHCHVRRGMHVTLGDGKGKHSLVYAEDRVGVCNARHLPSMPETLRLMRAALVLDELARI